MMKRFWKRAVSIAMALTLAAGGLTGCGGGKDAYENSELAKQYVYSLQELDMPELGADDFNIVSSTKLDDRVYLLFRVYHWNQTPNMEYQLISVSQDGSDLQMAQLEMKSVNLDEILPEDQQTGDEPEDEENPDETEVPEDSKADLDEGFEVEPEAGIEMPVEETPGEDYWENTYLDTVSMTANGIYGTKSYSYNNYTTGLSVARSFVCHWNLDGSLIWETDLGQLESEEEYISVNGLTVDADGNVMLLMNGNSAYSQKVSADGTLQDRQVCESQLADIMGNYGMMSGQSDGSLLIMYYDTDNWQDQYVVKYDPATDTLGEPVLLPSTISYNSMGMFVGSVHDLLYLNNDGLCFYNLGDEQGTQAMNYINSDLNISSLQSVVELDDEHFLAAYYPNQSYGYSLKLGLFTHVKPEDIPDKKVLVLGCNWANSELKNHVVEFNQSSQEYKVVIRDYESYNTYDDYMAGVTQLNNDIISGDMPDILVADSSLPISSYVAKGLLADIGKRIEEDEELSGEEFLQNVFDAYSIKGKLYYVVPTFYVRTMTAKTSKVGDRTGWTMEDMKQLVESLPEGTSLIEGMTRSYFISSMITFCGSDFVDLDTGKCNFDSEYFIDMMEFAKTLPEEINYDDDYWMNFNWDTMYREDRAILDESYITSVAGMNYTINGTFGEPVSFVGFPTESGEGGAVLYANNIFCISAKSGNQDGAWEFMRYFLTDEYQEQLQNGFPVQKDVFEEKAAEARNKPYYIDENGNKVEYDETYWMNDESITLEPMTQEQIDQVVNMVYSVNKVSYYDENVSNIINEEIGYFFNDQKSAQEVAETIQRRVQVYVDENN